MKMTFSQATSEQSAQVMMIAELGVNHDGSVARALELVDAAGDAGADAVKLQLFRPERLLSNQAVLADYQVGQASTAADLLSALTLSLAQMQQVGQAARSRGMGLIVTPFSLEDVPDVVDLEVDAVKVASPDAVNTPLLDAVGQLGLPLLISTGTCDLEELDHAAMVAQRSGGALLQCVSAYPVPAEQAALGGMAAIAQRWGVAVGYSDHTASLNMGAWAVAAGAVVIEKHLTYDREASGPDHGASLDPAGLTTYIANVRAAAIAVGPTAKGVSLLEADVRKVSRQSVCVMRDLPAGHVLTREDVTVRRPGTGMPARRFETCVGQRLKRAVIAGDLLTPSDL